MIIGALVNHCEFLSGQSNSKIVALIHVRRARIMTDMLLLLTLRGVKPALKVIKSYVH